MINLSLHHLNSDVYFFYLDEEEDFSKTNNITSIHKIPNQQIHNICAIDLLFYKSKKYHENFLKTLWPSKRKCWKKKMNVNKGEKSQIQKFNSYNIHMEKKMKGSMT